MNFACGSQTLGFIFFLGIAWCFFTWSPVCSEVISHIVLLWKRSIYKTVLVHEWQSCVKVKSSLSRESQWGRQGLRAQWQSHGWSSQGGRFPDQPLTIKTEEPPNDIICTVRLMKADLLTLRAAILCCSTFHRGPFSCRLFSFLPYVKENKKSPIWPPSRDISPSALLSKTGKSLTKWQRWELALLIKFIGVKEMDIDFPPPSIRCPLWMCTTFPELAQTAFFSFPFLQDRL